MVSSSGTIDKAGNRILAWSQADTSKVADFFLAVIAPQIKRLGKRYKHHSSDVDHNELRETVANDVVDDALLEFLRDNEFSTDKAQRKKLRKQIGRLYHDKLQVARQLKRGSLNMPRKSGGGIDFGLIPPKGSSQAGIPDDIRSANANTIVESLAIRYLSPNGADIASPRQQLKQEIESAPSELTFLRDSNGRFSSGQQLNRPPSPAFDACKEEEKDVKYDGSKDSPQIRTKPPISSDLGMLRHEKLRKNAQSDAKSAPKFTRNSSQRALAIPNTRSDSELELLIANAALNWPRIHEGDLSQDQDITESDQERLLAKPYVAKRLDPQAGHLIVLQGREVDPCARPRREISTLLRNRELYANGIGSRHDLRQRVITKLKPWRKWKGASSDITTVAWAPDSSTYAVGAAAHTNDEDLQYNRPCNLMLGELTSNRLWELPDHRMRRPAPETIAEGYNSSQQTYNTCDPMIYQTIHATSFSPNGEYLYTASRDHTVKVWDVRAGRRKCIKTLDHGAVVAGLSVAQSPQVPVFATARQSIQNAISVFYWSNGVLDSDPVIFSSSAALDKPALRILPECLSWGPTPQNHNLLLAGFAEWNVPEGEWAKKGQLCLWDVDARQSIKVTPGSSSVTALTWHPFLSLFATGGAPGGSLGLKRQVTKSVVRTYDPRILTRFAMEYESPAHDIQDITFHPLDSNIVTAGCTDGRSFVWDYRWPDKPIHILSHGDAVMELDQNRDRAATDTGVCMSLWGSEGSLYYTGSSDGVVKSWDVRRHSVDVHVKDIAHVGAAIQHGAFSPDFSHLLVGDADGAIHMLSSAPCGPSPGEDCCDERDTEETIQLIRAPDGSGKRVNPDDDEAGTEGIEEAATLVNTGQLTIHPIFGPGQGPKYRGPFAIDRRIVREDGSIGRLNNQIEEAQIYDSHGNLNYEEARFRKAHADRRRWEFHDRKAADPNRFLNPFTKKQGAHASTIHSHNTNEASETKDSSFRHIVPSEPYKNSDKPLSRQDLDGAAGARSLSQRAAFEAYRKAQTAPVLPPYRSWHATEAQDDSPAPFLQAPAPNTPAHKITPQKPMNNFFKAFRSPDKKALQGAIVNKIPESKMLEENHWWPDLGEEEIAKALAQSR